IGPTAKGDTMSEHTGPLLSRRHLLGGAAAGAAALAGLAPQAVGQKRKAALKGRIKQSIAFWCFNSAGEKWSLEKTCEVAKTLGCLSVELVDPPGWKVLKKHGLVC